MIEAFFSAIPAMIVLTGALVGVAAALPGTFLVLRGNAMLTDAISHSIVLGIVLVWMATGATAGPWQILGAVVAGLATVALTEALVATRLLRQDAATGLVFPALFAAGVLLINLNARDLHLDVHAVLLGEIGFVWLDTLTVAGIEVPRAVVWLALIALVNGAVILALFKELKLATFDPPLAAALGFRPRVLANVILALTSATAVAAFDAVGAVLFVAFAIVPAATALLLTDRLGVMLALACAIGVASAVIGYPVAVAADVSIGGVMALVAGVFLGAALLAAPRHGLIARALHRRHQRDEHDARTLVAHLHSHAGTTAEPEENTAAGLADHLHWAAPRIRRVILRGLDRGMIRRDGDLLALTPKGRAVAVAALHAHDRAEAGG